jgi:hypothetical protein
MVTKDRAEFKRLMRQIERDLLAQTHLKTLLATAGTTVAKHRKKLRNVTARLRRTPRVSKLRARR